MMRLLFQPSDAAEELLDDSSNDNGSLIDLGRPPRPPHHTNQPFTATSPVALVLGMIFTSIIVLILGGTAYQREGPPHGVQVVAVWIGVLATAIGVFYEFLDCHELPCDTPPGYHFGHSCLDAAGLAIVCALIFTLDGYGVCCGRPHPGRTAAFHGAASVFLLVKAVYAVAEGSERPTERAAAGGTVEASADGATQVAEEVAQLRAWLVALTAADVSLMLALRRAPAEDGLPSHVQPSGGLSPGRVHAAGGEAFLYRLAVVDVQPKPVSKAAAHAELDRRIAEMPPLARTCTERGGEWPAAMSTR